MQLSAVQLSAVQLSTVELSAVELSVPLALLGSQFYAGQSDTHGGLWAYLKYSIMCTVQFYVFIALCTVCGK